MCLLNGECGGTIYAATRLDESVIGYDQFGTEITEIPSMYQIIQEVVHHFGQEQVGKIIIRDLDRETKWCDTWIGTPQVFFDDDGNEISKEYYSTNPNYSKLYVYHKNSSICKKCIATLNPKFYRYKVDGVKVLALYDYDDLLKDFGNYSNHLVTNNFRLMEDKFYMVSKELIDAVNGFDESLDDSMIHFDLMLKVDKMNYRSAVEPRIHMDTKMNKDTVYVLPITEWKEKGIDTEYDRFYNDSLSENNVFQYK